MSTLLGRHPVHAHGAKLWRQVARPVGLVIGVVSLCMLATAGVGLIMDSPEGAIDMVMSAGIVGSIAICFLLLGRKPLEQPWAGAKPC